MQVPIEVQFIHFELNVLEKMQIPFSLEEKAQKLFIVEIEKNQEEKKTEEE